MRLAPLSSCTKFDLRMQGARSCRILPAKALCKETYQPCGRTSSHLGFLSSLV